jgi:hypothetical protein
MVRSPWETGFLKRKWKWILFFFEKRAFESKLEGILRAAAGHEGNSLPAGEHQYQLLVTEADSLCTKFADRWDLDVNLLRARIPGLAKLAGLSVPPPTKNYVRLACFGMVAILCLRICRGRLPSAKSIIATLADGGEHRFLRETPCSYCDGGDLCGTT